MEIMTPELSIIIPHYNDVETTIGTLDSLYDTIDIDNFEVIVVNDGSQHKMPTTEKRKNMLYVHHFVNTGVGQAFDTGVALARSDNLILMGADIRFHDNKWASRMLSVINNEPKSFICTVCKSFTTERREYGADIVLYMDNSNLSKNHPAKGNDKFRAVLQGKWRKRTGRGVYPIPSLMGAFYGVKKVWYHRVRGFNLHHRWGTLEPYISLKSWLIGGKVLIDTDNETMHIWRKPERKSDFAALTYNQLLAAATAFGREGKKFAQHLYEGGGVYYEMGSEIFTDKYPEISEIAGWLLDNAVMSYGELEQLMKDLSVYYNKEKYDEQKM